eukprot:458116-Pyramimonas_sp.AAC.1
MFVGALLATHCPLTLDVSLAGPVFGQRVAVLEGAPGESWQPVVRRGRVGAAEARERRWRLPLWQTAAGARASSS